MAIRALPRAERRAIGRMLERCREAFGRPHWHAGVGIRPLQHNWFECRLNRSLRFIFRAEPDLLHFEFMGDHNEVRRFLKNM